MTMKIMLFRSKLGSAGKELNNKQGKYNMFMRVKNANDL